MPSRVRALTVGEGFDTLILRPAGPYPPSPQDQFLIGAGHPRLTRLCRPPGATRLAAPGDENAPVVRRRRNTLVRESPLRCMARGPRVPLIAAIERVGLCPGRGPSGRRPPTVVGKEVVAVEVLFERVAGLDVGKQTLTVCVRTPGPGGRRVSQTRTVKTTTR